MLVYEVRALTYCLYLLNLLAAAGDFNLANYTHRNLIYLLMICRRQQADDDDDEDDDSGRDTIIRQATAKAKPFTVTVTAAWRFSGN